jgi:citrate synthase
MDYQNPDKYKNYWKTAISHIGRNEISIRGYPLAELSGRISYVDAIILCVRGELPERVESESVNAIFTAAMDHQFLNATALAARVVVSANPDPVAGIAAGILSFGRVTAGVPSIVVDLINRYYPEGGSPDDRQREAVRLVTEYRGRGERIPGFGHPLHDLRGPHYTFRSQLLHDRLAEIGLPLDDRVAFYEAAHTEFLRQVGKPIPINVDGLMGAAFAQLGYLPLEVHALAPFTMLPGIVAHVVEEIRDGVPLRIVPESEYVGPAPRSRLSETEPRS